VRSLLWLPLVVACTSSGSSSQALSGDVRDARLASIRDISAQMGLYNGALLGGIAVSETGLCQCWSEATWACQGPASPSCDNGPVIAGAADGPCSDMQGGLGMFQFDAGTYAQTLAAYGDDVLTVEGNTALAVSFVETKVVQDIAGATDWMAAMGWMNDVPLRAGDPVMEQWSHLLACRYNGCCTTSATCTSRANGYRDNAIDVYNEMGGDFWNTAARCAAIPGDGVIDQRSDCYVAAGDPRFWRHETAGYGGSLDWTLTTNAAAPANFAEWLIRPGRSGHYHIEVALDGGAFGQSHKATYQIVHAGATDAIVVDQASATGFVALGDFEFSGDGDEYVMLADATGEPSSTQTRLLFDAIRVTALDGGGGEAAGCGGCAAGGGAVGGSALVLVCVLAYRRHSRRRSKAPAPPGRAAPRSGAELRSNAGTTSPV